MKKRVIRISQYGLTLLELMMVVCIVGFIGFAAFLSVGGVVLSDNAQAIRAAETHGFSSPKVIDSHVGFVGWRGCGEDDGVAYDMQAVNPAGKTVAFKACCGTTGKGCTLRVN